MKTFVYNVEKLRQVPECPLKDRWAVVYPPTGDELGRVHRAEAGSLFYVLLPGPDGNCSVQVRKAFDTRADAVEWIVDQHCEEFS